MPPRSSRRRLNAACCLSRLSVSSVPSVALVSEPSVALVAPQGDQRIELGGSLRRQEACDARDGGQQQDDAADRDWIPGAILNQQLRLLKQRADTEGAGVPSVNVPS